MNDFNELTTRGRANRLRKIVQEAITHYDLQVTNIRLLDNGTNGVFRLDTEDGEKYVIRITNPDVGHSIQNTESELMWLDALSKETELTIPAPVKTRSGKRLVTVEVPGVPEPRVCAIFTWVPGKNLADDLTPLHVSRQGELMAKLHNHAATFHPDSSFSINTYDSAFPFNEEIILLDESNEMISNEQRELFRQVVAWTGEVLARYKEAGVPRQVIHNDFHQWNIRLYRGRLSAIDFEDLMWGYPFQDIATSWYYYYIGDSEKPNQPLINAFREGYEKHAAWPAHDPGDIHAFIAARGMMLLNYVLASPLPELKEFAPVMLQRVTKRCQRHLGFR